MANKIIRNIGASVYSNDKLFQFGNGYYMVVPDTYADSLAAAFGQLNTVYFVSQVTIASQGSNATLVGTLGTVIPVTHPVATLFGVSVVLSEVDPTVAYNEIFNNNFASGITLYEPFLTLAGATALSTS